VAAIALCFFSGMVPQVLAVLYALLVAAMLLIGRRAPASVALAAGVALWLGATAMFAFTAGSARAQVNAIAARQFPQATVIDRIVTPMPVDPACWEVMLLQRQGDEAVLRRAMLALAPAWLSAEQCLSRSLDVEITAPLVAVPADSSAELKWYGQVSTPIDRLAGVASGNCQAAAALRFIRMPWLASVEAGLVLGDLRYDREQELGFAEILITEPPTCPALVPEWTEPRADDLLGAIGVSR
ncbi:MAG: hypothetical protein SXG53_21470, partial [Pseudomonadota bacterium]|nr:hypothetical protein [Pseudomonadota bacterium]